MTFVLWWPSYGAIFKNMNSSLFDYKSWVRISIRRVKGELLLVLIIMFSDVTVLLVPWTNNNLSSFKCGFLNIFSRQNLLRSLSCLLFLLWSNKYGAKKCLKNHIPFDFWDSTLANQGAGKTIEKPLKELPWNQQGSVLGLYKQLAISGRPLESTFWNIQHFYSRFNKSKKEWRSIDDRGVCVIFLVATEQNSDLNLVESPGWKWSQE